MRTVTFVEAITTLGGGFVLISAFLVIEFPILQATAIAVGAITAILAGFNTAQSHFAPGEGTERFDHICVLNGLGLLFLIPFWPITPVSEIVLIINGGMIAITGSYAAYLREHQADRDEEFFTKQVYKGGP